MMSTIDFPESNPQVRAAWNANAAYWDDWMGEGNRFVEALVWPATMRLLDVQPGQRILDVACGNGLYARKLAALGAQVVAFDLAEEMIVRARARTAEYIDRIDYRVLDATDERALLSLGERQFDAAICPMAIMDMAEITPLMRTMGSLLRPGGRFVFAVMHPCFNHWRTMLMGEQTEQAGRIVDVYSIKVSGYLTPMQQPGEALRGQPELHLYFHRPLHMLLGAAFSAGLVMDGLEEPAFAPDEPAGRTPLSWGGKFSEFPPALVARLKTRSDE